MKFLKDKGVYNDYKAEIDFIYLKKGYLTSVFNYVYNSLEPKKSTVAEIRAEMMRQVPDYGRNAYFRSKMSLRMLDWLLKCMPGLALKLIPVYIKRTNQVV